MESDFVDWVEREFRHPVPGEYRDFLFRDVASAYAEPVLRGAGPSRSELLGRAGRPGGAQDRHQGQPVGWHA